MRYGLPALVAVAVLSFASAGRAQSTNASLTGRVTDPTKAVMQGAKVIAINAGTNVPYRTTTNVTGNYYITNLPPGTYRVEVEAAGFKTVIKPGVVLNVQDILEINFEMALGSTVESVTVTAGAPILHTQDAVTGQELDRTFVNNLPLVSRSVLDLAYLTPGVLQPAGMAYSETPGGADIKRTNNFVSNGSLNATADILLDGVTDTQNEPNGGVQQTTFNPSVDAVQEFKVQQNNFSAEIGFSGAKVVSIVTRSGTNGFHGSAFEFLRNQKLDANNWFNNASGLPLPPLRNNEFGGTLGGPIRRDRTFFFVDYQGIRSRLMSNFNAGVPSAAERMGDFGELCALNGGTFDASGACSRAAGQLWDPYEAVYDPSQGGPVRSHIIRYNNLATYQSPGNPNLNGTGFQLPAAPGNLIDPVAYKMMQYYPLPNVAVGTPAYNYKNNWAGTGVLRESNDQFDVKIDHRFTDKDLLSVKYGHSWQNYHTASGFNNALDKWNNGPEITHPQTVALNFTHSLSPSTVLNFTYGWTRFFQNRLSAAADYPSFSPVTTLGMPSYIIDSGINAAPQIYVYGGYTNGGVGASAWVPLHWGQETHHLLGSLSTMRGRHELKFGGEWRVRRLNFLIAGAPEGVYTYDFNTTSQNPWSGGGDALASFLTGVAGPGQWGEYEMPAIPATQNFQYAGYFQDNWRVTDKLTLNLGIRYDLNLPRMERHNRQSWFDPNAVSPLQVPELGTLHGGLGFASPSQRSPFNTDYHDFGPRIGLAYQFNPKTVLRTGYGIFYSLPKSGVTSVTGGGDDGWVQYTPWVTTYKNDLVTPWGRISNPFPAGILYPPGSSQGLLTNVGLNFPNVTPFRNFNATPYVQTWNLGFQRELPGGTLLEANYVGTKGTRLLYYIHDMNIPGIDFATWTPAQIATLNNQVANPFYGIITNPAAGVGPTTTAYNLLKPFPQFGQVEPTGPPWGNSIYHALQMRFEKRLSNGLQFLVTYTISKAIDDSDVPGGNVSFLGGNTTVQDPWRRDLQRAVAGFDIPQVFQVAYVYELPFGRGKRWGSGWNSWVNGFLGGWQTNGIWRFDNGQPLSLGLSGGTAIPGYGLYPNLIGQLKVNPRSKWFCTDPGCGYFSNQGANAASTDVVVVPPAYTLGTAPRNLPNIRAPGTNNASLSLFKQIPLNMLREGTRLEFRAEAFNTLNHPQFCGPNTTVNGGTFGQVQSQCNSPREVQLALKLYF